jgi:hypothetical protein
MYTLLRAYLREFLQETLSSSPGLTNHLSLLTVISSVRRSEDGRTVILIRFYRL